MQNVQAALTKYLRMVPNFLFDLRYGGSLAFNIGIYDLRHRPGTTGDGPSEYTYNRPHKVACLMNSGVELIKLVFDNRIRDTDVLVDVGCGRGRVIAWWLDQHYENPIYGLELDPATAERTRRRYRRYPNVTIITGDAVENLPANGTLFYLYNPFDAPTLAAFRDRLKSITTAPDQVRILYYTPHQLHVFEDDPDWDIQVQPLGNSSTLPFNPVAIISLKH
jgi:SAM-dependent methyltransferase